MKNIIHLIRQHAFKLFHMTTFYIVLKRRGYEYIYYRGFPSVFTGGGGGHFHLKSVAEDSSVTQAFKTHPHVTCKKGKCLEVKCQLHELKHQLPISCFHIEMACFFLNCSARILFSILINLLREGGSRTLSWISLCTLLNLTIRKNLYTSLNLWHL